MKYGYDPVKGTSDDDVDPDAWQMQFDRSSSSGLICLRCHALVPHMPDHAQGHLAWHDEQDNGR